MFLEISQNSQENTRGRVSFLIKKGVSLLILQNFYEHLSLQNTYDGCFWLSFQKSSFFNLKEKKIFYSRLCEMKSWPLMTWTRKNPEPMDYTNVYLIGCHISIKFLCKVYSVWVYYLYLLFSTVFLIQNILKDYFINFKGLYCYTISVTLFKCRLYSHMSLLVFNLNVKHSKVEMDKKRYWAFSKI